MRDFQTFVFTTDWHVTNNWPKSRVDNFLEAIFAKISWVIDFANQQDAHLILGGDLLDKYNTNPELVNSLIKKLRKANNAVFSVVGNHDVYGQNYNVLEKVIIGTMYTSGVLNLLTTEPIFIEKNGVVTQLTGANYIPGIDVDKRVYYVKKHPQADHAIHVVHGFLVTKHWPTLSREHYTVVSEVDTEANVILTGHEHQGFGIVEQDGKLFSNPGALGRISSNIREIKRMPKVTLIKVFQEFAEISLVDVPARPGNEVLSRKQIEAEKAHKRMLAEFSNSLENEGEVCDLEYIFKKEAKVQGIDEEVSKISWKAIQTYEKKLAGDV